MSLRRHVGAVTAAGVTVAVLLAGCGSSSGGSGRAGGEAAAE